MIAERLRRLLHERARQRDRRHGTHQRERRDHDALAVTRHHHDVVEDLLVDATRRIDVRHRHQRRPRREVFDRAAVLDRRHARCASSACTPPTPRAAQTMSAHSMCARYVARWRIGHWHVDRSRRRCRPASAGRRARASDLQDVAEGRDVAVAAAALDGRPTFGAPLTGPKFTTLPPTCRSRAGIAGMQHEAFRARAPAAPRRCRGRCAPSASRRRPSRRPRGKSSRAAALRISSPASSSTRIGSDEYPLHLLRASGSRAATTAPTRRGSGVERGPRRAGTATGAPASRTRQYFTHRDRLTHVSGPARSVHHGPQHRQRKVLHAMIARPDTPRRARRWRETR